MPFNGKSRMFKKILIANRGEIALRIMRSCRELGIETVAVHAAADRDCLHVKYADESVCVGKASSAESYLKVPNLIAAAQITGAEAIHPGYGFLAENADFAEAVTAAGLTWIGPTWIAPLFNKFEPLQDDTLRHLASTYDAGSDRLSPGIGGRGPRALTFAPLLVLRQRPLNELLKALIEACEQDLQGPVEIEFAAGAHHQLICY